MMNDFVTAAERVPPQHKWYTAYEDYKGITLVFNSYDEAIDYAIHTGVFEEVCGKDNFDKFSENLFFDVEESELDEHSPYLKVNALCAY